jgi:hypothetical protein
MRSDRSVGRSSCGTRIQAVISDQPASLTAFPGDPISEAAFGNNAKFVKPFGDGMPGLDHETYIATNPIRGGDFIDWATDRSLVLTHWLKHQPWVNRGSR